MDFNFWSVPVTLKQIYILLVLHGIELDQNFGLEVAVCHPSAQLCHDKSCQTEQSLNNSCI